jgi:cob(I)alamin adenosyltransferase
MRDCSQSGVVRDGEVVRSFARHKCRRVERRIWKADKLCRHGGSRLCVFLNLSKDFFSSFHKVYRCRTGRGTKWRT